MIWCSPSVGHSLHQAGPPHPPLHPTHRMIWCSPSVDHSRNWCRHWSTLTLLVHRHSTLFLTRAAAATPTSDLPAPQGSTMMPLGGGEGPAWLRFACLVAEGGSGTAGQRDDEEGAVGQGLRLWSQGEHTTIKLVASSAGGQRIPYQTTQAAALRPLRPAPARSPDRARPFPNILPRLFSW